MSKCKDHPDAPHGFDRNASHNADRYVCECESWEPKQEPIECMCGICKLGKRKWVGLTGMTLRDYFAAKAMQALIPSGKNVDSMKYAESAYALADAMLKAREA
jgi:hypothetical protein